jgi:hypothetical protein
LALGALITILLPANGIESSTPEPGDEQVVYRERLNPAANTVPSAWSEEKTTTAPGDGGEFRGPFQAQPVALSLSHLPEHAWVKLRCTLFVIGSWDGSNRVWGPDLWSLHVRGGQRLFFTTFGNMGDFSNNNVQSYPDEYPWGRQKAWTGAVEKNVLGFPKEGGASTRPALNDGVYHIDVIFPHARESLILDFAGIYDDPPSEKQSWGVANLEVVAMKEPPALEEGALPGLWDDLAGEDPMQANAALWKMVAAGDRTAAFIAGKVAELKSEIGEPKRDTPPVIGLEALRLHRARRILRVLGVKGDLRFAIDHLVPEYFRDLEDM